MELLDLLLNIVTKEEFSSIFKWPSFEERMMKANDSFI